MFVHALLSVVTFFLPDLFFLAFSVTLTVVQG